MFFLRITFNDGVSPSETVLIKRPAFTIGTSRFAHLVIEGAGSGISELQVTRGLADTFICEPIGATSDSFEDSYSRDANISYGGVDIYICLLDIDMRLRTEDRLLQAGIEFVRKAAVVSPPVYPALSINGDVPCLVSLAEGEDLIIGRSGKSTIRLDTPDISGEHLRVVVDRGDIYLEDLGSTNGTFLNGEAISSLVNVSQGDRVNVGKKHLLAAIYEEQEQLSLRRADVRRASMQLKLYPCLYTQSDLVKPSRFVFLRDGVFTIGREPANDIWIGAAHISRSHCEIEKQENGALFIRDLSSNGTVLDGVELPKDVWTQLSGDTSQIDFGGGAILYLCNSEDQEQKVRESGGRARPSTVTGHLKKSDEVPLESVKTLRNEQLAEQISRQLSEKEQNFSSHNERLVSIKTRTSSDSLEQKEILDFLFFKDIPKSSLIIRIMVVGCFCFLLGFVAYVLYGIVINL